MAALAPIPPVLTIADLCGILRISERQFYTLKDTFFRDLNLLVEVEPRIDARVRYLGEPIAKFLSAEGEKRALRHQLRAVESR